MSDEYDDDWIDFGSSREERVEGLATSLQSKLTFTSCDEIPSPTKVSEVAALPEEDSDEDNSDIYDGYFGGPNSCTPDVPANTVPPDMPANTVPPAPVDSDSGWLSDPETAVIPQESPRKIVQVYRAMGYDEWEEDIKAAFMKSWTTDPDAVRSLMREMFEEHEDVHEVVLFFLRHMGKRKRNSKTYTLHRTLLLEFLKWKKEKEGKLPKNAELTVSHKQDVLALVSVSHTNLIEVLAEIYQLQTLPSEELVQATRSQLSSGRLKEAVICAYTFGVQQHFNTAQMLLPLVAVDKINLIERYVECDQKLQEEFVRILDDLGDSGDFDSKLFRYMRGCEWADTSTMGGANSKLHSKQVHKLGMRFVEKYGLRLKLFPSMSAKKSSGFLHHVLSSHYVNEVITKSNIDDLIQSAIAGEGVEIYQQLVSELVKFGDVPAAAKWALKCSLEWHTLPGCVQNYIRENRPSLDVDPRQGSSQEDDNSRFMAFSLPMSAIMFVDDKDKLMACHGAIVKPDVIIGIDSEWKLVKEKRTEKLALLQLAVEDKVFLLDMIALPQVVSPKLLSHFFSCLFGSKQSLKLGYGIQSDLVMLKKTLPFLTDIVRTSQRVLDLDVLDKKVEKLCCHGNSVQSGTSSPVPSTGSLPSPGRPRTPVSCSTTPCPHEASSTASAASVPIPSKALSSVSVPLQNEAHSPDTGASPPQSWPSLLSLMTDHAQDRDKNSHLANLSAGAANTHSENHLPAHPLLKATSEERPSLLPPHPLLNNVLGNDSSRSLQVEGDGLGECGGRLSSRDRQRPSGLSALVAKYLGKPLDKSYQLSDWERRPLWKEQVVYAAQDAHCLLAMYQCIMDKALSQDPLFSHC